MLRRLLQLLSPGKNDDRTARPKGLVFDKLPDTIFAVGDIHGCLDLLLRLEEKMQKETDTPRQGAVVIHLGDYIDRGPASQGVIRHLMEPPVHGMQRLCLMGNHEAMFLDFFESPSTKHPWLKFGGQETLASYGLYDLSPMLETARWQLSTHVPAAHVKFIQDMPLFIQMPGYVFVHAGLKPGLELAMQREEHLLWSRPGSTDPQTGIEGLIVVHGHTPVAEVEIGQHRVNVDTGAFYSGLLSAVKITPDGSIKTVNSE